ncbi:galactose-binding domain-like protein, partial [Baffinella frigidus]
YLEDHWATNLQRYTPFETKISVGKHTAQASTLGAGVGKHTSQSSTLGAGVSRLAVDGSRSGVYSDTWDNSVTLTNTDAQAWWQVDLGGPNLINNVTVFGRTDNFAERLENFYVLFSSEPFLSDRLQDLLEDPLVHKVHLMYLDGSAGMKVELTAQYVRVQLAGTNYLSLAEVEIYGHPPIEPWQNIEGMKRWTELYTTGDTPKGRYGASQTMISAQTVLMYGGYVKEAPYFLGEFWSALLPAERDFQRPVQWTIVEPKRQKPLLSVPVERYGHTAAYSQVCTIGYDIEKGVREGTIVLETPGDLFT